MHPAFARRVGDDLAERIRADLDKRGAADVAKSAGVVSRCQGSRSRRLE
jgi:hypothetical protein